MDIARIDSKTSKVVNTEEATTEWIKTHSDPNGPWIFVPYTADNPAVIGLGWDPIGGFEQPKPLKTTTDKKRRATNA